MTPPTVVVLGWTGALRPGGGREALALVDGVRVRVRRCRVKDRRWIRWCCDVCGVQINHPRCPHARAFAATPVPPPKPSKGPP